MPFKAKLDGKEIISCFCDDKTWRDAQDASKGKQNRLQMSCCEVPAIATHSSLGTRYFAHKIKNDCPNKKSESPEHLYLKAQAVRAVKSLPNWNAQVEISGDGWRADVLAVRKNIKIAIEIQLSSQAKRETHKRSNKFKSSEVSVFWLKGHKNYSNDFGAGLQAEILGDTLEQKRDSIFKAINNLLSDVERQVKLANGVTRLIKNIGISEYKIQFQGSIPASIEITINNKEQIILLGELGAAILPKYFENPQDLNSAQFSGAVIQLRIKAPHLRGYHSSSFVINEKNIDASLSASIKPILEGKKKWQGEDHKESIPGSFIYYVDDCEKCKTSFLRITHVIKGHPRHTKLFNAEVHNKLEKFCYLIDKIELVAQKMNIPIGTLRHTNDTYNPDIIQCCPKCHSPAPSPLIDDEDVLSHWTKDETHFEISIPHQGNGWGKPTIWIERPIKPEEEWNEFIIAKKNKRLKDKEEQVLKNKKEKEEFEKRSKERENQRKINSGIEVAIKILRDEKQRKDWEKHELEEIENKKNKRKVILYKAAEKVILDSIKRDFWLDTTNKDLKKLNNLKNISPLEFAAQSDENLNKVLGILKNTKFK